MEETRHAIVLFDGVCNFCDRSVQFIIKRDPYGYFKFASLQSKYAQDLMEKYHIQSKSLDSMILIERGKAYRKTAAALRIALNLNGFWPLAGIFLLVPFFIRDLFYNLLAANRYRFYGKKDECMIPAPEIREKFIA